MAVVSPVQPALWTTPVPSPAESYSDLYIQQCKQLSHYTLHRHITLDTTYCVGSYTIGPTGFPFLKGPDDGLPLCLDLLQLLLVVVSQRCHEIFTLLGFPRDISLVVLLERNANRINCKIHECVLTGVANVDAI